LVFVDRPPGCICASHSPWNGSHTPSSQATQPGLEHTTAIQTQSYNSCLSSTYTMIRV